MQEEEKRKKKKEAEIVKEELQKPKKKVKIDEEPKIKKKRTAMEELDEDVIQTKEEELLEQEILTDEEKQILIVLDFVDRRKSGLRITGFQVKDFLELIFPSKDVDIIYFQLKEKDYISKTGDSEEFLVSYKGRQEAEKYGGVLKPIFENIGERLEKFLKRNELLKRILYFSYLDEWKLRNYILKIKDNLNELEQVLSTFFLDRSFLDTPVVSKVIRILRKEQPMQIIEILTDYCKDLDFLKALSVLRLNQIKDKIGIETIASLYYENYLDTLSKIIERAKVEEIIKKLLLLGISESENLFDIDIDSILTKEENISRIKEWIAFDKNAFKNLLENDWNLFINIKNVIENTTPFEYEDLISTKAVLLYKNNILVRKEVKDIFDIVYKKVEEMLKNKINKIENALIFPFYSIERDKIKELKGKIIISLHAYDWSSKKYYYPTIREEELENNVILLISPKEIGYKIDKEKIYPARNIILELPDKNVEFNAIGKFENLERVKFIFDECEWILEEEYQSVKRAREIIEEKKIPKISLEEALEEIKKDEILTRMLFLVSKFYSHNNYYQNYFWSDIRYNLISQFGISEEKFEELKKKFIELIEKRVKSDFEIFYGKNVYDKCKEELMDQVLKNIEKLDENSKKSLYIFLLMHFEQLHETYLPEGREKWFGKFKAFFQFLFNESFSNDLLKLLLKLGLIFVDTWITWRNNNHGSVYHVVDFFDELKSKVIPKLEETLDIRQLKITEFVEKYKMDMIELIGLDYLLHSDGFCIRDELRDVLWKISLEAWNQFESYDGVISSQDSEVIAVNPLLLDELKDFVNARKREMIESQVKLKKALLSLKIIDSMIEFDEKLVILKGFITMWNKEVINVIIAPWYLPLYEKFFGEKTLIIITNQPDYKKLTESLKELDKEITLIFLKNNNFYLLSNFRDANFINSLLSILEEAQFALISKEIIALETLEEARVKVESITPQIAREEMGEGSKKEELDLFKEFFETDFKNFPIGLGKEEPIVLILSKTKDDEYSATLQILCREIYRELIKGLPHPKRVTDERVEDEIDISGRIIFVDEDKAKELGLGKFTSIEDVNWTNLGKKLQEFFSRYFGFFIFEIPSDKMEVFKEKVEKYTKNLRPRIIQVFPMYLGKRTYLDFTEEGIREISDLIEFKKKICSIIWGFITPQKDERWEQGEIFDNFFASCEEEYKNRLRIMEIEKIIVEDKEISVPILVKRGENESDLHFRIKVFIVKYLYEIEKYSKESVKTEYKLDEKNIYPDVQVGNIIFEVETLYNSERPLSKIVEKTENYRNSDKKINIVLKNIDVFLYYKHLIDLEKELREEGIDVKFKTLNLKDNTLIHIKEISKSYFSLFK